jgi:hypothetical protein
LKSSEGSQAVKLPVLVAVAEQAAVVLAQLSAPTVAPSSA